jgi:hypothetical protein
MSYKEIIIDALRDYKNNEYGEQKLSDTLERICERYKELELGDENIYGLCMHYLYYFKVAKEDDCALSNDVIEDKFTKLFYNDIDELLGTIELFKWVPESYSKVLKLSSEIFDQAKKAYHNEEVSVQDAEQKLEEIIALRKEIESQEFKYRDKREIIADYEVELSECILDVDTIEGERFIQSIRFGDYIDYIKLDDGISEVQKTQEFNNTDLFNIVGDSFYDTFNVTDNLFNEGDKTPELQVAPEFNNTNIFKMPDKLF